MNHIILLQPQQFFAPPHPILVHPPPPLHYCPRPPLPYCPQPPLLCPSGIRWNKPPPGFVKLNTDASYKYISSKSSIAGVCRDEHGIWLFGFSCRVKSESAFEAELLAVREALKLAWDKGLKRVIVESDSESVVNRIRNQLTRQPKNQIEAVILECQSYVSREWNCFLQHTHREGNFAADALTKIIISESFELHVFNHPPKSLSLILLADKIGMAVPRHGALDRNQIGHLKVLKRELLARNLHWY
jgi:ribonuclease HI